MTLKEVLVDDVLIGRLYQGHFKEDMAPRLYDETRKFLCMQMIQRQMRPVIECDELWIKVNQGNERPSASGSTNHPAILKAVIDHILNVLNFKGPIRISEASSIYKGPTFFIPPEEPQSFFNCYGSPNLIPAEERQVILAKN